MLARRAGVCNFCGGDIAINDVLLPVLLSIQTARKRVWVHSDCALTASGDSGEQAQICKHWAKKGECLFGEKCAFLHPKL